MNELPPRRFGLRFAALGIALLASPIFASRADAQIQLTPDSGRYLIQRFVPPNEQWAISYNFDDGTLTGNVFKTDGGEPSFIWCQFTDVQYAADPLQNAYTLDCWGADACTEAPCSDSAWVPIAEGIPLPASFVLPPETKATFGGQVEPIFTSTCATAGCHDSVTATEGLDLSAGAAYDNILRVMATQDERDRIHPFDADQSYLFLKLLGQGSLSKMPLVGSLDDSQIEAIRNWIEEGAVRN